MLVRHAAADHHPDLHWLFPEEDKTAISVEQIRSLGAELSLNSHAGGAKVVKQSDGSWLVKSEQIGRATYTIKAKTAAKSITAIRLEAI